MALNVAKVTFAFAQGVYGWTESYFRLNPSSSLQAELDAGEVLALKRIKISGAETRIDYIKASNETLRRDVLVGGYNIVGISTEPSDAPDTALLAKRYPSDNSAAAPIYLRGIWDSLVIAGGNFDYSNAAWLTNWNGYKATVTANGWGFLARNPAASVRGALASVVQNADKTISLIASTPLFAGLTLGERYKVFVSGVQGAASANGANIATVTSTSSMTTVRQIPMFPYTVGGIISVTVLQFFPCTRFDFTRIVERKVGRPLFVSRGRSRARKLA